MKITNECLYAVNYIITRINQYNHKLTVKERIFITTGQIQRLLYLCQIEHIKEYGELMFNDSFNTWNNGPAIGKIYNLLANCKSFKFNIISTDAITNLDVTNKIEKIIDKILTFTTEIDTKDLEELSKDKLWQRHYDSNDLLHEQIIPNEELLEYYKGKQKKIIK